MQTSFKTISKQSESYFKDKNSKFYGFAFPITNKEDIKERLIQLKLKYPDATHHCYAWTCGIDKVEERANDDGEPSSSAGKPILRQIYSKGVQNTLVVVVRYYGGKKLGVPGLINAYGEAAKLALNECEVVEKEIEIQFEISCPFGIENEVYRIAKRTNAQLTMVPSMTEFKCQLKTRLADKDLILESFRDLHKIEIQILE